LAEPRLTVTCFWRRLLRQLLERRLITDRGAQKVLTSTKNKGLGNTLFADFMKIIKQGGDAEVEYP